jgi:CheY-like chemotaxis protein
VTHRDVDPGGLGDDIRVVVVDDSPTHCAFLRVLLTDLGAAVVATAATGELAVERVAALRPHLVVMDFHMPGIDGAQATRRILRRVPDVEVVGCSASPCANVTDAFRRAGAAAVFDKARLEALGEHVVRRARLLRAA